MERLEITKRYKERMYNINMLKKHTLRRKALKLSSFYSSRFSDAGKNKNFILQKPSKEEIEIIFRRVKRGSLNDLNKSFNWSSQSMEKIVDEIVKELPMKSLKRNVKTDLISEIHMDKLKNLGKVSVDKDFITNMVKLEVESDDSKIEKATEDSVKKVIIELLAEVLSVLNKNQWMKDVIIKLFEEGYSVDSVVDEIVKHISIEELLKSMEADGVNMTKSQKELVLFEFKSYKSVLNKMLRQEILLWEYQLSKNITLERRKRNILPKLFSQKKIVIDENLQIQTSPKEKLFNKVKLFFPQEINEKNLLSLRNKRELEYSLLDTINVFNNNVSHKFKKGKEIEHDQNQRNIDKELAALEKSSMSDSKKMKTLKKHLKWLQSQTENPANIIFSDNFEEELMKTENYYEDIPKPSRRFKQRFQWNVRTRKPTLKIITFLPKIRLTRGKPFVPLTTTEEVLTIPETIIPTRRKRTRKPMIRKKEMKRVDVTFQKTIKKSRKIYNSQETEASQINSQKHLKKVKSCKKSIATTAKTFATVKTYHTMRFGKKTQQPVISLQEFLKRRNEFRRVREEVMWNKNFLTSDEGKAKEKAAEPEKISEELSEEELSFDAKLSCEVKPADFTLRPMSDFLYIRNKLTTKSSYSPGSRVEHVQGHKVTAKPNKNMSTTKSENSTKGTRKKYTKKTGYTKAPRSHKRIKNKNTTTKKIKPLSSPQDQIEDVQTESEKQYLSLKEPGGRNKRDLSSTYSLRPFTNQNKGSTKDITNTEELSNQENIPTQINQASSQHELKPTFHSKKEDWFDGMDLPSNIPRHHNTSSNSFETYQQEHKKWFGERRRGIPVNNFDIDWSQMRRKLEIQEISMWQTQKQQSYRPKNANSEFKMSFSTKKVTKEPIICNHTTNMLISTGKSTPDSFHKPRMWFDNAYEPDFKKYKSKPYYRNYISKEHLDLKATLPQHGFEPPFGKADKNGKTAFGRLYQEPKKRHYRIHDDRDAFFNEDEIKKIINKTYDTNFRIQTHRKTQWFNRTFDPNYIFTQLIPGRNLSKTKFVLFELGRQQYNKLNSTKLISTSIPLNNSQVIDPDFDNYVKILSGHHIMSLRPKHLSFKNEENNTVIINKDNNTFILQRSYKVPWDNKTDPSTYKTYQEVRKRFYNKTIDIVFSYYIFHKFKCGNVTRDVGYGRMSNVVNRWYNRTFIPKYRPDMFYVHNRYKTGKDLNYYKNEFNMLHSMISEGKFHSNLWTHVTPVFNISETKNEFKIEEESTEINRAHDDMKSIKAMKYAQLNQSTPAVSKLKVNISTTASWKEEVSHKWKELYELKSTSWPFTKITTVKHSRASFFQSVKEKGFDFFRNLFTIHDSDESEEK